MSVSMLKQNRVCYRNGAVHQTVALISFSFLRVFCVFRAKADSSYTACLSSDLFVRDSVSSTSRHILIKMKYVDGSIGSIEVTVKCLLSEIFVQV